MNKTYRELLNSQPKQRLSFLPTPLQRLDRLSDQLGVELYLKRDDMTGISQFGGNKIRKLEYLLGDAVSQGCDTVFTFGATQSNHAMQTATACRRLGLTPILYLVAVVEPSPEDLRSNLLLDQILGAEIHIIHIEEGETEEEAEDRAVLLAREQADHLEAEGHRCYLIPMGGANEIGSCGFVEGYLELQEQLEALRCSADFLFHAVGTGGTMAGLAAGRCLTGSETRIISVLVSPKGEDFPEKVEHIANGTLTRIGADPSCRVRRERDLTLERGYFGAGYEIPTEASSEAIRLLARTEGVLVDPVYTGKAFSGMLDYIRSGRIPRGSTVVFWHTGGATALFAEKSILGEILNP